VLNRGKIIEEGTHSTLMAQQGLYAELFTLQASGFIDPDEPAPAAPDGDGLDGLLMSGSVTDD
jgi:hypothetical protein